MAKFDIYGRFVIDVRREGHAWAVYRVGLGTKVRSTDIVVPAELGEAELSGFLDDLFHELSGPGDKIEPLA